MARKQEREFAAVDAIIERHWERAVGLANAEALMTYWTVGAFVSAKLKSAAWGAKVVEELSDYLKTRNPKRRGFGKRQIYNMVAFYDAYSSPTFRETAERLRLDEFVQSPTAQIVHLANAQTDKGATVRAAPARIEKAEVEIVHLANARLDEIDAICDAFPLFLSLTTFTNHILILNRCDSQSERIFYILHAARERLNAAEMTRAIVSQTYDAVMSKGKKMSPKLKAAYPGAEFLLKDKALLDFLNLPPKHNEHALHRELVAHMREFVLEMGKDFLYMGDEYHVHVGGEDRRLDLLFYHRGLRCLVDVELKAVDFEPEHVGKIDMYLEAIDREIRREGENPSVGLILCPSADRCRVAYTLNRTMSPVMVAEYRRLLVPEATVKKSLQEYCAFMKDEALCGKGR